jgi:hypothetical protein
MTALAGALRAILVRGNKYRPNINIGVMRADEHE